MGGSIGATAERARVLIDELAAQQRVLAAAQARQAALMLEFDQARTVLDRRRICDRLAVGADPRFAAGEFAAMEIGLAITATKQSVQRTVGIAARLGAEAPEAWDAWLAGDIDLGKAARINHALLRLTRASSKQLLNALVVPVASCKTAELLGRWLNQFVAKMEPEETDERLRRSLDDRYVSVRPDLDGVSFLSAAMSSLDAAAIDLVLDALAGTVEPGDSRTWQQRRADILVDLLLGRASNGCHATWTQDDNAGGGDEDPADGVDQDAAADHLVPPVDGSADPAGGGDSETVARPDTDTDTDMDTDAVPGVREAGQPWNSDDDFDLPASAFRRTPDRQPADADGDNTHGDNTDHGTGGDGRIVVTPCPGNHQGRPLPVTIGVVISAQSLFGYTNTPGQLADRSALVPAGIIRGLAEQPDTLFYRLLTDEHGNLLAGTELGRFPSRKLGATIKLRDGTCTNPSCHTPAHRCDLDHLVPAPEGPTTAENLGCKCRTDHRAKTHADHHSTRTAPHTSQWKTPTGHTYTTNDDPLPVENWPDD